MLRLLLVALAIFSALPVEAKCSGKFINPLTDICWRCVFPLRFGSAVVMGNDQDDSASSNDNSLVCNCGPNWIGISTSFWEPSHMIDISTDPYCTPSLGGDIIGDVGFPADGRGGIQNMTEAPGQQEMFYHYVTYRNPILAAMQFLSDNPCIDHAPFDILDFSAVNPAWSDANLSAIFNPDSFLYGTLAAVLTGIPVGVCSTFDTRNVACLNLRRWSHWSVGFNGGTYPLQGTLATNSTLSASMNIAKKAFTLQHRTLRVWGMSGSSGMCGYYPQPFLDDTDYKLSMTYPRAQTDPINGKCCQPFGASTLLWGAGRTWPVTGEDMSYMVFRKRDCCMAGGEVIIDP